MMFLLARIYIYLLFLSNKYLKTRYFGLGFVQRQIQREHWFSFEGQKMVFSPLVDGSYNLLLIGQQNEPETHVFFNRVLHGFPQKAHFVNIGTSVGEMIFGITRFSNIESITGFEPRENCCDVIRRSAIANNEQRIRIVNKALGCDQGKVILYLDPSGVGSSLEKEVTRGTVSVTVDLSMLDLELNPHMENTIILIDVEGKELDVIKGAKSFIQNNCPLIIFEYNEIGRRFYKLEEIEAVIGSSYKIFRLRGDGFLDTDIDHSYNCVAISENSRFAARIPELLYPSHT